MLAVSKLIPMAYKTIWQTSFKRKLSKIGARSYITR